MPENTVYMYSAFYPAFLTHAEFMPYSVAAEKFSVCWDRMNLYSHAEITVYSMVKKKIQEYNFLYQGRKIPYSVSFDRFKTIRLRVKEQLEIKMPYRTPLAYAEKSIAKHLSWILAQLEQRENKNAETSVLPSFTQELFIFGRAFTVHRQTNASTRKEKLNFSAQNTYFNQEQIFLHALPILQNSHASISLINGEIFVQCKSDEDCKNKLTAWRKKTAQGFLPYYYHALWQIFQEKIKPFLLQHAVTTSCHCVCPELTFRTCKRCFGSCKISHKNGETCIMLSTHLMGLPLEYIEFVILHEFCHLIYPNHSPHFYALFDLVLPRHHILKASINSWSKTHIPF